MSPMNLRKHLRQATVGVADSVSFKRDGTLVFKRGYFYRHGMDEQKFAKHVLYLLEQAGVTATLVSARDRWAPWPRDSFFEVTVSL